MYKGLRVAVVMPVYNERGHVRAAILAVPSFVDTIVVVDDASTDGTELAISPANDPRLVKLRHQTNQGVGAATKTGYRYCLRVCPDVVAVMDGDGQMDGGDLSELLDRIIAGADYVRGCRFLHKRTISCMPRMRYIGNRVFSLLTRWAGRFGETLDAQCGYSAIRLDALERLDLSRLYDRYGFPNEMFFAARLTGLAIENVPVTVIYGNEVSHINPLVVVPTILYLIARGYLRSRLAASTTRQIGDAEIQQALSRALN